MRIAKNFGSVTFTADGTLAECFQDLAEANSVFAHDTCGMCGSKNVAPAMTKSRNGDVFLKMKCQDCTAELGFFTMDGGGMFAVTKDKEGGVKPNGGWNKYVPQNTGTASRGSRQTRTGRPVDDDSVGRGRRAPRGEQDQRPEEETPF